MSVPRFRHNIWVNKETVLQTPYIHIEFNHELSIKDRVWFNDLLIAGLYPMFNEIRNFAQLLRGWHYPNDTEKLRQVRNILHKGRKWELKEAFNYMLLHNVPPQVTATNTDLIQLLDAEQEQKELVVSSYYDQFGKNHEKKKYQMILTNEVERKAIENGSYKFILYAFYVYRTYRYWIDTSLPLVLFDYEVRNYFFDIKVPDTISRKDSVRLTAQERFFRSIKQYVIDLYAQEMCWNGTSECDFLIHVLQHQMPNYNWGIGGIPDVIPGKLINQTARGSGDGWHNKVTPFQYLLGDLCTNLRPNCVEALLGFKRYLLNMPWFCKSVINIGIEPWQEFVNIWEAYYRRTGIGLSVRGAFKVGGFGEEAPPQ